ncbi:MAG: hypothetical protein M0C28_40230 [Candidatus Moduliflexus flocculans]|nr:hypothetical protein [Candidatus Moduliflexus flocculans]
MKNVDLSKTLTSLDPAHPWAAGQTLAGKYTILGELGKGGMGRSTWPRTPPSTARSPSSSCPRRPIGTRRCGPGSCARPSRPRR